jgi:hypothetical protein
MNLQKKITLSLFLRFGLPGPDCSPYLNLAACQVARHMLSFTRFWEEDYVSRGRENVQSRC